MLSVKQLIENLEEHDWRDFRMLSNTTGIPFPQYLQPIDSEKKALAKVMKQKGHKKCKPMVETDHLWLDEGMTFDEAIEMSGYGRFHFALLGTCGFVVMLCAVDLYVLAAYLSTLACMFDLQPRDVILLNVVHFSGAISGSLLWGMIGDSFGRRIPLYKALLLYTVMCFANIIVINYVIYMVSLFFLAFSIWGAMNLAIVFLVEFQPRSSRGFAVAGLQIFWVLGIAVAQGFAFLVSNRWAPWTLLRVLPSLPAVALAALLWRFFPETPRFLYTREILAEYKFVYKKMKQQCDKRLGVNHHCFRIVYHPRFTKKSTLEKTPCDLDKNATHKLSIESKERESFDRRQYRHWVWIMREPIPVSTLASLRKVFKINNKIEPYEEYTVTNFSDAAMKYEQQWKQHWISSYIVILLLAQFFLEHGIHALALWFPDLVSRFQAYCLMHKVEGDLPCNINNLYFTGLLDPHQWCHIDGEVVANSWAANDEAILHVLMVAFSPLPGVALMMLGIDQYGRKLFLAYSHLAFSLIVLGGYFTYAPSQELVISCLLRAMASVSTTASIILAVELSKTRYRAFILGLLIASGRLGAVIGNSGFAVQIIPTCGFLVFLTGLFILCFRCIFLLQSDIRCTKRQSYSKHQFLCNQHIFSFTKFPFKGIFKWKDMQDHISRVVSTFPGSLGILCNYIHCAPLSLVLNYSRSSVIWHLWELKGAGCLNLLVAWANVQF